ncbi:aminotransferase DegT [Nocardiopsis terrae]|uniref:Aminotransferase n=1 Tax=Nocardiopsis terrae TaxID=372655 RepID=A0ABR9HA86_9ACTN|nr:DegT/DnrJ/EryC1/StrS family aminotransferase [Nocardiopsis terrae]MBE1455960.1 aminotransferase [Nocardiopsis terrae]GHC96494.1 aminotransferase DegT [Nocardiopsis terrae]
MIHLFQPQVGEEELAEVAKVFADRWIGLGPRTREFEAEFAAHVGVDPAGMVFLNSGTAGLFLALEALDLSEGDEVVLPTMSFVAAANAVMASGARPVFCDSDPRTLNPTPEDVEKVCTDRTRAVIVLHYGGYPGWIAGIADLCARRGITLVEDAACSVSSSVDGRRVGSFGDMSMWSFDAMKVLVTGDGGMLYSRDTRRAERIRRLAYHGLAQPSGFGHAKTAQRWWDPQVAEVGRRDIGNDLTAAIGSVQLRRLPEMVGRRRRIVELYASELEGVHGLTLPPALPPGHTSTHYFFWVQMPGGIRDEVARRLLDEGVYTTFRYAPLHRVPLYGSEGAFPGSDQAAAATLCLPLHPGLSDADVRVVAERLRHVLDELT